MSRQMVPGPGAVRVGRFIGRLGVVSLQAVGAGLDLDQRVVRRHVARLEAAGWLERAPWVWGEGSIAWLTGRGIEQAGLGGVRAVKSPPGATTIAHGVLVGWSAARIEHRRRIWKSARELALEPERWAVTIRCERGYTKQLPDLAVWLRSPAPVAVIAESGGRREDRQKMILEGWRDAILTGWYSGVHYHCSSPSVAHWITRLAKKVNLTGRTFRAEVQMAAAEIAALPPAAPDSELPVDDTGASRESERTPGEQVRSAPVQAPAPQPAQPAPAPANPTPERETSEAVAEPECAYREIFGIDEPKRRRWRR